MQKEPRQPANLGDFEIDFRLWHLAKRNDNHRGRVVWSPRIWQNAILTTFGAGGLIGFYVIPALNWDEVRQADTIALVLAGIVLAVLFLPLVFLLWTGLFRWTALVIDRPRGTVSVRQRFSRQPQPAVAIDQIARFRTDRLRDESGIEVGGYFLVVYAELKDGRLANIAVEPDIRLIQDLKTSL